MQVVRLPVVMFLARSLSASGGAERQLMVLCRLLVESGYQVHLVLFYGGSGLEQQLESSGVRISVLDKSSRWDVFGFWKRLLLVARRIKPDIVHGYLPVPNFLAVLVARRMPGVMSVVGLRASNVKAADYDWFSRLSIYLERFCVRFADLCIVNSRAGLEFFKRSVADGKVVCIPNGIDTERFLPNSSARQRLIQKLSLDPAVSIVGHVGRMDPMKDHRNLLQAFMLLRQRCPQVHLICVTAGNPGDIESAKDFANQIHVSNHVSWLAPTPDIEIYYPAFDVFCLSSAYGEGFPNVIGEAMSCDVPCVATDVGDSGFVIGSTGWVVAPRRPDELAEALVQAVRADRLALKGRQRARIENNFSLTSLVASTSAAFQDLVERNHRVRQVRRS